MADIEALMECVVALALTHVRDAIAKALPPTPEAALAARNDGRPDAMDMLAAIHNSLDDEVRKFVAAHPTEFARARASVSDPAGTG